MWTCPVCQQSFVRANQTHSCNDRTVADFLAGKSAHTLALYHHFLEEYGKIGDFVLHPAKSRISLARQVRFCSINQLGRDFLHVVFTFKEAYYDNLCFIKIGQFPGSQLFNHHCRLYRLEDLNEEVLFYMRKAYEEAVR